MITLVVEMKDLNIIEQMINRSDSFQLEVRLSNHSPKTEKPAT